jgi:hypothetical protein
MDDKGEGGCSDALIMLDKKAKESILEGVLVASHRKGGRKMYKKCPYSILLNLNDVLT